MQYKSEERKTDSIKGTEEVKKESFNPKTTQRGESLLPDNHEEKSPHDFGGFEIEIEQPS